MGKKLLLQIFCTVIESAVVRRFLCTLYADLHKLLPELFTSPLISPTSYGDHPQDFPLLDHKLSSKFARLEHQL